MNARAPYRSRREVPVDPALIHLRERSSPRPATEVEAVMQASPHETPSPSREELEVIGVMLAAAVDALPPLHRDVFNALVIEGMSVRALGRELGYSKSYVHKVKGQAIELLRSMLSRQPVIIEYLGRFDD